MPTYEFRCENGHATDRFFRTMSTAPAEIECPECGAVATRQLSGGAGLLFKGSGFYLTDYGKNAHRKSESKASDSKGSDGKADAGKSEGKATPKPESTPPKADAPASSSAPKSDKSPKTKPKTE